MAFWLAGDVWEGEKFFSRSAFRSGFFVADTVLLGLTLMIGSLVLASHWHSLTFLMVASVSAVLIGNVMVWLAALRAHRRIHSLYQSGAIQAVVVGSPLELVIRVASGTTHLGLFCTPLFVSVLLMRLDKVLPGVLQH